MLAVLEREQGLEQGLEPELEALEWELEQGQGVGLVPELVCCRLAQY